MDNLFPRLPTLWSWARIMQDLVGFLMEMDSRPQCNKPGNTHGQKQQGPSVAQGPCPMRSELYPCDFIYPNHSCKGSVSNRGPTGSFKYEFVEATYNSVHNSLLL